MSKTYTQTKPVEDKQAGNRHIYTHRGIYFQNQFLKESPKAFSAVHHR